MTFLQETYGKISPTNLMEKEDEMKDFVYNPVEPIDTGFNKIDRFSDLCELASDPILDRQQVNLGYKIIFENNAFRDSLKVWNKKPTVDKPYATMKMYMREEYNYFDEVGALTIKNTALNQANILQLLKNHQEQMFLRMEKTLKVSLIEALTGICGDKEYESAHPMYDFNAVNNIRNLASGNKATIMQLLTSL